MSFGLSISPAGSASACQIRVRLEAFPPPCRPGGGPGSLLFTLASPPPLLPAGKSRISGISLAIHPVTLPRFTTPNDPLRFANSGASGTAPTRVTMKASSFSDFEAARRFITCLRFTTRVSPRRTRLTSDWRAPPLPGGRRTCWVASRGFSSSHPPRQGCSWRKKHLEVD